MQAAGAASSSALGTEPEAPAPVMMVKRQVAMLNQRLQYILDQSMPFTMYRWIGFAVLVLVYIVRILALEGWYIVTYALGIYLLNLLLLFLSPKLDPAMELMENDDDDDLPLAAAANGTAGSPASFLPTKSDDEFRPFIRRLPEFKFWWGATRATLIAMFCTFFKFFDIPVFWPILLVYFILLFTVTMRRQIKHMIKYRYLPFTVGKRRYSVGGSAK